MDAIPEEVPVWRFTDGVPDDEEREAGVRDVRQAECLRRGQHVVEERVDVETNEVDLRPLQRAQRPIERPIVGIRELRRQELSDRTEGTDRGRRSEERRVGKEGRARGWE